MTEQETNFKSKIWRKIKFDDTYNNYGKNNVGRKYIHWVSISCIVLMGVNFGIPA